MSALILAGFFLIWQAVSVISGTPLLPSFIETALNMITSPRLLEHLLYSLCRMTAGLTAAAVLGLPLGMTAGRKTGAARSLINIPSYLLHPVPKTVFIPVIVLFSGIGEFSKILLVFLSVIFQIIIGARDAAASIAENYYTSAAALGCKTMDKIRYITFPAALPSLFSTLRISMGTAAAVLFFSEYFGTEYGMGFFIMDARARTDFTDLYSGILALSLMMLVLFRLTGFFESRLCRWKRL